MWVQCSTYAGFYQLKYTGDKLQELVFFLRKKMGVWELS